MEVDAAHGKTLGKIVKKKDMNVCLEVLHICIHLAQDLRFSC